jgi:hypothetical protein
MAAYIYGLCAFTALLCSGMLLRAYFANKYKLLLWGGLCFVGLTINNIILIIDKLIIESIDFTTWRLVSALISMLILLYGLIWDTE